MKIYGTKYNFLNYIQIFLIFTFLIGSFLAPINKNENYLVVPAFLFLIVSIMQFGLIVSINSYIIMYNKDENMHSWIENNTEEHINLLDAITISTVFYAIMSIIAVISIRKIKKE